MMKIMNNHWDIKDISWNQSIQRENLLKYPQILRTEILSMREGQTFHGAHAFFAHQWVNYEKVCAVKNLNTIWWNILLTLFRA